MEPDFDGANLSHVLEQVARDWHVDRARLLLTGMSDGGTFALLSGSDDASRSSIWHRSPQAVILCC
jgi:phospholipase/carboxylesterase